MYAKEGQVDYNIRIVEHGAKAVVAQGDPAHDLCRALKRMGYANIVLPLQAFATGKVSREYIATGAAFVVEDLIDAEEQMLALEREDKE